MSYRTRVWYGDISDDHSSGPITVVHGVQGVQGETHVEMHIGTVRYVRTVRWSGGQREIK